MLHRLEYISKLCFTLQVKVFYSKERRSKIYVESQSISFSGARYSYKHIKAFIAKMCRTNSEMHVFALF